MDYTQVQAVVTSSSTISVRRVTYTVPSQLQGQTLQVRLYDNRLECFCGAQSVITLKRVYAQNNRLRARSVDYRHVIHALVKKPQAFRYSQLRDELLPNEAYRRIWHYVDKTLESRAACRFITGVLHLAATSNCEAELGQKILSNITQGRPLSLPNLQATFSKREGITSLPAVPIVQHALAQYDELINPKGVSHA